MGGGYGVARFGCDDVMLRLADAVPPSLLGCKME